MSKNAFISNQRNDVAKTIGRKRARNEGPKRRISANYCCQIPLSLPLTVTAGIVAVCSFNGSDNLFASAFYHPTALPTINQQALRSVSNQSRRSSRQKHSLRHDRKSTIFWVLNDTTDSLEHIFVEDWDDVHEGNDRQNSRNQNNSDDGGSKDSCIVESPSPALPAFLSPRLPPWLALIEDDSTSVSSHAEASKRIRREMELLEGLLLTFQGGNVFSKADATDIIRAIYWCASANAEVRSTSQKVSKIVGSVTFCRLLLQLEDDTLDNNMGLDVNHKKTKEKMSHLITKDVLLASILHYSECFDVEYDRISNDEDLRKALCSNKIRDNSGSIEVDTLSSSLPPAILLAITEEDDNRKPTNGNEKSIVFIEDTTEEGKPQDSSIVVCSAREPTIHKKTNDAFENIFSKESLELAKATAGLKQMEILMSSTFTSSGNEHKMRRRLKKEEYAAVRNLMVSVAEDWRALAIRCVASLFRLEGILNYTKMNAGTGQFSPYYSFRDSETTLAAKDSLQVYAHLSKQLGLHRLHTQLEAKAFRILYPRQYSASSHLFREHGTAMNAISGYLSNQLKQLLCEDLSLMFELENLEVVSRVKEPYSFWKKLLKKRIRPMAISPSNDGDCIDFDDNKDSDEKNNEKYSPQRRISDLSIMEVNDGVALRVILKARKLDVDEPDEITQKRERMLCYYVHQLVRSKWPETDPNRVKDYIRNPKPNGYQSLHHTSKFTRNNQDFFFEVQIRSEEMHRLAEFGVAAHSLYKLNGGSPNNHPALKPSLSSAVVPSASAEIEPDSLDPSSAITMPSNKETLAIESNPLPVVGLSDPGNSGPYIYALRKARQSLMQSHIYVFLEGGSSSPLEMGQLLTLSAGSLVVDVLDSIRQIHEEFDFEDDEVHVWCNGKLALLEENVKNGDMILIEPLRSSPPSFTEILVNQTSSWSNTILVP